MRMQRAFTKDGRRLGAPWSAHHTARPSPGRRLCVASISSGVAVAPGEVRSAAVTTVSQVPGAGPARPPQEPARVGEHDFTNINRRNFAAVLPIMRAAIKDATFVAIDTEFTGLSPEGWSEELYDTYESRYNRLQASSSSFLICQFGLTAFKWLPPSNGDVGGRWETCAFNAYIFPQPDDTTGWDKRFTCQASSLAYLVSQGFDFNKMIRDGIGYMPLNMTDSRKRALREHADNLRRSMEFKTDEEAQSAAEWRAAVGAWLHGAEPELQLRLPRSKRLRLLQRLEVQALQLPSLGYDPFSLQEVLTSSSPAEDGDSGSGGAPASSGSGSRSAATSAMGSMDGGEGAGAGASSLAQGSETDAEEGASDAEGEADGSEGEGEGSARAGGRLSRVPLPEGVLVLRRLDQWWTKDMLASSGMQMTAQQQIEMLMEQSGFAQVLDVLREARRPVVVHNGALDLAYTLAQFAEPLPRSWAAYKELVQRTFPGGLYDTKHIAQQLVVASGRTPVDTALGSLFAALTDDQWLRQNARDVAAAGLPLFSFPPGFESYVGAQGKAHEAGFDSLMTGCVFARLLRIAEVRGPGGWRGGSVSASGGGAAAAAATSGSGAGAGAEVAGAAADAAAALLRPLAPYRGRLFMMRSDLPYADLYGTDPVPARPAILHVSGFTPNTRPSFLVQRFQAAGLGQVQITMLRNPTGAAEGALVLLPGSDAVHAALQKARKKLPTFQVTTFAEYHASQRDATAVRRAQPQQQARQAPQAQQGQQRGGQRPSAGQAEGAPERAAPRPSSLPPATEAGASQGQRPASGGQGRDGVGSTAGVSGRGRDSSSGEQRQAPNERRRLSNLVQQMQEAPGRSGQGDMASRAPAGGSWSATGRATAPSSVEAGTKSAEGEAGRGTDTPAAAVKMTEEQKALAAEKFRNLSMAAMRLRAAPAGKEPQGSEEQSRGALHRPERPHVGG